MNTEETKREKVDRGEIVATHTGNIAWVWIFPILAAMVAGWLFWKQSESLGPKIEINPNMKRGIEALYDYTSDEQGIRHALLEESANVTFDEAQFMLSACAAFVSYFINRHDSVTAIQKS